MDKYEQLRKRILESNLHPMYEDILLYDLQEKEILKQSDLTDIKNELEKIKLMGR